MTQDTIKLKITIKDKNASPIVYNTSAARDFIALLPLDLPLEDYANTEKIAQLPKKLSTENTPKGFKAAKGDITYYAPWGNLAFFYRDFGYADGLISLGKITEGIEIFSTKDSLLARIEIDK